MEKSILIERLEFRRQSTHNTLNKIIQAFGKNNPLVEELILTTLVLEDIVNKLRQETVTED